MLHMCVVCGCACASLYADPVTIFASVIRFLNSKSHNRSKDTSVYRPRRHTAHTRPGKRNRGDSRPDRPAPRGARRHTRPTHRAGRAHRVARPRRQRNLQGSAYTILYSKGQRREAKACAPTQRRSERVSALSPRIITSCCRREMTPWSIPHTSRTAHRNSPTGGSSSLGTPPGRCRHKQLLPKVSHGPDEPWSSSASR